MRFHNGIDDIMEEPDNKQATKEAVLKDHTTINYRGADVRSLDCVTVAGIAMREGEEEKRRGGEEEGGGRRAVQDRRREERKSRGEEEGGEEVRI